MDNEKEKAKAQIQKDVTELVNKVADLSSALGIDFVLLMHKNDKAFGSVTVTGSSLHHAAAKELLKISAEHLEGNSPDKTILTVSKKNNLHN